MPLADEPASCESADHTRSVRLEQPPKVRSRSQVAAGRRPCRLRICSCAGHRGAAGGCQTELARLPNQPLRRTRLCVRIRCGLVHGGTKARSFVGAMRGAPTSIRVSLPSQGHHPNEMDSLRFTTQGSAGGATDDRSPIRKVVIINAPGGWRSVLAAPYRDGQITWHDDGLVEEHGPPEIIRCSIRPADRSMMCDCTVCSFLV